MGIAYQDLKQGSYYKGYHMPAPNGLKCFFYVEKISNSTTDTTIHAMFILRGQGATSWRRMSMQGAHCAESLCKQEVRASAVTSEGLPLPTPASPQPNMPLPYVAPVAPPVNPLRKFFESEEAAAARLKAQSKMEKNKGKSIVYGNVHSPVCLKCGNPNKQVPMMAMYWCPCCEPE